LSVEYTRPAGMNTDARDIYLETFNQKQPGVSGFPLETIIEYPLGWNAQFVAQPSINPEEDKGGDHASETILANEGRLEYNTTLQSDVFRRIRFTR